ncbi:uncharacterized mitochondrial protein AtMg00810-like [Lathyrus oleraceus]|uniref:uncharacterized mitochondrial protein AtMg00810-like n=1 Tax=Pisum sativum TaxID=3888 RepID=UPI0021CF7DB5|nr:uncharacterized mitochondrial protein AtMg00810-like [Pisum sativum]
MLMNAFEMIDMGNMVYFLWMDILYSDKGIILHQLNYELELLKRFKLTNCKTTITHAEMNHKLDSDVVGDDVNAPNFKILVGSLRYLRNTRPDICYAVGIMKEVLLDIYKYMGGPISWCYEKKLVVALSICETEYIASVVFACQAICLRVKLFGL